MFFFVSLFCEIIQCAQLSFEQKVFCALLPICFNAEFGSVKRFYILWKIIRRIEQRFFLAKYVGKCVCAFSKGFISLKEHCTFYK